MDPTTLELLRQAAIDALQSKQDVAASEILSLMDINLSPSLPAIPAQIEQPLRVLPQEEQSTQFPPLPSNNEGRDYHFWVQTIRDCYLPALANQNQTEFTTPELFSWFDFVGFPLTTGDLEMIGSRPCWKCRVGNALERLCEQNIIHRCGLFSRTYSTVIPQKVLAGVL